MKQNYKKIKSVALHISGSIHQMIVIVGTHVQNYDIARCVFHFFKILNFWLVRG